MPDVAPPPSALGDVDIYDLASAEVGDTFRVFVGRCGEVPHALLLVTDANGMFGMAVDTVRLMQLPGLVPPMLVVGVGYPAAATIVETVEIRARDLTPTQTSRFEGSGGGDAFLGFIRRELLPWIAERAQTSFAPTIYFGHSLGGLFGAHALLSEGATFDHWIISSPSLWWDHHVMFERERSYAAAHTDLTAGVWFGIGGEETDEGRRREGANLPYGHPMRPARTHLDMVADMTHFVDALRDRGYPSLTIDADIYPDEFHATVAPVVLSRGLRKIFAKR
ncbi:MAG TPA: alpha/beta hydrolase-fold protein [Ilumatobacteraceae bacterium]|nr:alpha/beta hydrolase-fold protein [Ilumatobacteraceae bacterium]